MKRPRAYPFTNPNPPGLTIFVLRTEKQWSCQELADAAGISMSQVARIESGEFGWTRHALIKIAGALGRQLEELFLPPDLLFWYHLEPHQQAAIANLGTTLAQGSPNQPGHPPLAASATKG